jgi:cob(I)alamin adenosyltransferase
VQGLLFGDLIHKIQENLFIVQAELAGANKTITKEKVTELEDIIQAIEKELPPIKTFFISGGTSLAALFDCARTLVRRAERRVVQVSESKAVSVSKHTLAYLNRLSSVLYALARLTNHKSDTLENAPTYR